jgi:hypothetical protein
LSIFIEPSVKHEDVSLKTLEKGSGKDSAIAQSDPHPFFSIGVALFGSISLEAAAA